MVDIDSARDAPIDDLPEGRLPVDHPLPAGMRDLLPMEAEQQTALVGRVLGCFALHGYERVGLPAFEHAAVLERGIGPLESDEVLRFVEPESGEIVVLRPDLTPQVARLFVTRLFAQPLPARLAVQGPVWRRRRARARRHQQIPQAGIELLGLPAAEGDLEVLEVAVAAVRAAGLERFVVDLGHVGIAGALLEGVAGRERDGIVEALAHKDSATLAHRARAAGLEGARLAALQELPTLQGGGELWSRAEAVLAGTPALAPLGALKGFWEQIAARGWAPELTLDLGETTAFDYYTGVTLQILAEGPGEAIGSGGRYDHLLGRFDVPLPAAGFALDLDNLAWALRAAGHREVRALRVLVAGRSQAGVIAAELRARAVAAAVGPMSDAAGYAAAWRFSHALELESRARLIDLGSGAEAVLPEGDPVALAALVAALLQTWEAGAE